MQTRRAKSWESAILENGYLTEGSALINGDED